MKMNKRELIENNPAAGFMFYVLGVDTPDRNDCGYEGRYDLEDCSRIAGFGRKPGEGACDYPSHCPHYDTCKLANK